MPAKKKPVPAMKKTARQLSKRKPISVSPMQSSESGGDGEPVEEVQQVHCDETETVTVPVPNGPTSTATTTTPTLSTLNCCFFQYFQLDVC